MMTEKMDGITEDPRMDDLRTFSREFISEFIEIYRQEECLWKTEDENYKKKAKRRLAYEALAKKLREVLPNATRDDAVKRISNLRRCLRKERQKIELLKKEGTIDGRPYVPRLWYYNRLRFIWNQDDEASYSHDDMDVTDSSLVRNDDVDLQLLEEEVPRGIPMKRRLPKQALTINVTDHNDDDHDNEPFVKRSCCNCCGASKPEDPFSTVGKCIANKLRELSKEQCSIAEKLINDVLFEANYENLTKQCKIVLFQEVSIPQNGFSS